MIISSMLFLALATDTATVPMTPSGKWTVDYRTDTCIASRPFGTGPDAAAFAIEPAIVMSDTESAFVFVVAPNTDGKKVARGSATITGLPSGENTKGQYVTWPLSPTMRGWEVGGQPGSLPKLDQAKGLTIEAGTRSFAFQTGALKPVLDALKTCSENLMRTWGVDPTAKAKPAGNPANWFTDDDYPDGAKKDDASGRSVVVATVGADGKVSACRIVFSSKNAALDETSCKLTRLRGRFDTAPGKNDRYAVISIRWVR